MVRKPREPFLFLRFSMAVSSLSPLFILIMAKGSELISDLWLITSCLLVIAISTSLVFRRMEVAKRNQDSSPLNICKIEDSRDHLLVYLFAVLVPLFQSDLDSPRSVLLFSLVFMLVIFLFIHLRLYYANIFFAMAGYKVYTVTTKEGERVALLSRKETLNSGTTYPIRVSNFFFLDAG